MTHDDAQQPEPDATDRGAAAAGGGPEANGTAQAEHEIERMRRAEEMVDRLGERVGHYVSLFGRQLLRWSARAREEFEDMWAEAQDLRDRQKHKAAGPPEETPPANGAAP